MPIAELEQYDIMHVDGTRNIRELLKTFSELHSLSYFDAGSSLQELEQALEEENRAKVYVLDRQFKRGKDDETTSYLDEEAEALIKGFDENPLFIIFASEEPKGIDYKVGMYFIRKPNPMGVINLAKQLIIQPY